MVIQKVKMGEKYKTHLSKYILVILWVYDGCDHKKLKLESNHQKLIVSLFDHIYFIIFPINLEELKLIILDEMRGWFVVGIIL